VAQVERTNLAAARDATATALQAMADAVAALDLAKRTGLPAEVQQRENEHQGAVAALAVAQTAERATRGELDTALRDHVGGLQHIGDEVALLRAAHPIVLFPVRIETRFDLPPTGPAFLRIRVYPDEIFADDFEELLTRAEEEAGLAYWAVAETSRRAVWDDMASRFGGERSAWIVKTTRDLSGPSGSYRPEAWSRAVEARLLPDRWIVVAQPIGGSTPIVVAGLPIQEPLALTLNPNAPAADTGAVDDDVLWTIDYARAVAVGMAVDVSLDGAAGGRSGFSQVLVLGVKASLSPEETTAALTRLFAGHRFGRGFDFVAQGTPTNNTAERPAGYPAPDQAETLHRVEVAASGLPPTRSDGREFLDFLGLDSDENEEYETWRVAHAAGTEQANADAMNLAIWPATWGYYLQHMMDVPGGDPIVGAGAIEDAKRYFAKNVRGRGPLPAFRIGGTPYGVLPISTLDAWVPAPGGTGAHLPPVLRLLRTRWRAALDSVPRVRRQADKADEDLIRILGQHPSTREVRVRSVIGPTAWHNLLWLLRRSLGPWAEAQRSRAREVFGSIAHSDWFPRVARTVPWLRALRYKEPIVGVEPLSEGSRPATEPVAYIDFLRTHDAFEIRDDLPDAEHPKNLLYRVLRHATLAEYARVAWEWTRENYRSDDFSVFELIFRLKRKTVWARLAETVPLGGGGEVTVATWLATQPGSVPNRPPSDPNHQPKNVRPPRNHLNALESLSTLSDAELERLFTEALDLCTYRLDAWITAVFTERLRAMRTEVEG
jgi:hypothetical protein